MGYRIIVTVMCLITMKLIEWSDSIQISIVGSCEENTDANETFFLHMSVFVGSYNNDSYAKGSARTVLFFSAASID